MTNPDNVGVLLPELPKGDVAFREDCLSKWQYAHSDEQMRAYGELCRAAPAGGDDGMTDLPSDMKALTSRNFASLVDSAPAGSGEVDDDALAAEWLERFAAMYPHSAGPKLRHCAALLRKLQQGAE